MTRPLHHSLPMFILAFAVPLLAAAPRADAQSGDPSSAQVAETPLPKRRAVELALDGNYAAGGSGDLDLGGGAALRAGYAFPFRWAAIVPELGIDAYGFGGVESAVVYGGFAGARARFGQGFEPGLFAHVGVNGVSWRDDFAAPSADIGLFVELTYIRRLILGAQGAYKSTFAVGEHPAVTWYTFGLTVGTRFD